MVGSSLGGVLRGILLVFVWIALQLPIGAVAVAQVSENSATALSAAPSAIAVGQTVTLTAAVTNLDASFLPTATVVFTDLSTGTVLGSVFQVGAPEPNTYSLNVTTLAAGNHSIQASYSGGNYVDAGGINKTVQPSDSNVVIVTVTAPPASVALSSSQNPSQVGQAVTFTATVTGLSPTGSVTFRDGATVLGTVALSGGQANLSTSALAAGSHSITAEYGGDANNAGSTSAPLNQQVNQAGSGVSLASSVNPSIVGQAVTFTATVTGASPTGSVTFRDGATVLGTVAL
ncbi:MAG: Ig-like domain-containing protein, partial [Pseudorhodoplanes sp.]